MVGFLKRPNPGTSSEMVLLRTNNWVERAVDLLVLVWTCHSGAALCSGTQLVTRHVSCLLNLPSLDLVSSLRQAVLSSLACLWVSGAKFALGRAKG